MKRVTSWLAATGLVVLAIPIVALAGANDNRFTVDIDLAARDARAALGTVRNSVDSVQRAGCKLPGRPTFSEAAQCYFVDSNEVTATCYTFDPNVAQALYAMNGDSYVQFGWDENGECTYIAIENDSAFPPKSP